MKNLTKKEGQVLCGILLGYNEKKICKNLNIGRMTLNAHKYSIYNKLNRGTSTEVVYYIWKEYSE